MDREAMGKKLADKTKRINHMVWCVENQMEKVWDHREELAGYLRECLRLMAQNEQLFDALSLLVWINAPANSQEAVRDARENNVAFSNGLDAARKALEVESSTNEYCPNCCEAVFPGHVCPEQINPKRGE